MQKIYNTSMANFWEKLNKPIITLAPMAGVTDIAFRQICKQFGADVIFTEFASTNALVFGSDKTIDMLRFAESERPVVVQLFGNDPEMFARAAKIVADLGFDGIDINFGCPAYKVVKHGGGVALMRNLPLCRAIIEATIKATCLPVSIKIRASICKETPLKKGKRKIKACGQPITALDLVETIKDLPVASLMIHARSFETPFDGEPNVEIVKKVREIWPGILIYNGGVYSPETAKQMLEQTGADGIGLARGAWGRPWLFEQVKNYLRTGSYNHPDRNEIKQIIIQHASLALKQKGDHGLIELRKHLVKYVKGWPEAASLRAKLVQVKSLDEIREILKNTP